MAILQSRRSNISQYNEDDVVLDPVAWCEVAKPYIESKVHGLVPFTPYDFQKQIMRAVAAGKAYVIDKSSQIGASTAVVMGYAHQLIYRHKATGIPLHCHIIANSEEVAVERLLKIAKVALDTAELSVEQRKHIDGINPKTKNVEIRYYTPSAHNYIRAHPSKETASRSFDGNAALMEEVAYMPYAEGVWRTLARTLDDMENAPIFLVSTYNGDGDFFCECVDNHEALGLIHLPIDWRAHPGRWGDDNGKTWKERSQKKFSGRIAEWEEEHELKRIKSGEQAIDVRIIEEFAASIDFIGHKPIVAHRYSKGVDTAGSGRDLTVHTVIDLHTRPPQVVSQFSYPRQSTTGKVATIETLDKNWPGSLFIDGTKDSAIPALVNARTKVAVNFTAGHRATERVDRVEGLQWRNVPRSEMLSWLIANLESGTLIVHLEEFPKLREALRTARMGTGEKRRGKNVDFLDSLMLANLALTKRVRRGYDKGEKLIGGIPSSDKLRKLLRTRW